MVRSKLAIALFGVTLSAGLIVGCAPSSGPSATDTSATETPAAETAAEPVSVYVEDGVAIKGADPVAYFTEEAYVVGSSEFTHEWMNATWHFSSAENRDLFASDPELYAPKYGGFCAWAVSQGNTAPIDPTAWKIVDGSLYLNYDARIQERWAKDIPGNIAKADENWPGVLSN
ncbi:MAG: YHS domain-containing (seleno)protein [Cyanobacteria bacterium P01_A01_bin.123]